MLVFLAGCRGMRPDEPPVAEFTYTPEEVRVGEEVQFDASGSYAPAGEIVMYLWEFGDEQTASGVMTTHTYAEVGTPMVVLTVADDGGRHGEVWETLNVLPEAP